VSDDVVGQLVDRFHLFQGRLRDMVVSLAAITEASRRSGHELSANTIETSAATVQIRRNAETVLEGTRILENELGTVTRAKDAINDSALKTFEAVNRQSMSLLTLASLMESNLEETLKVNESTLGQAARASKTLDGSQQSLEGLRQVAAATRSIQEDGREIQALVIGIEDVAEQISILGVNAAIEAARAGASGRGFSVVADQVRKLAELSKTNAGRVAETLGRIQGKVETTATVSARSEGNLTDLMTVIQGLSEAMNTLAEILASHADNSRVMLQALKDLEGVTGNVNDGTNSLVEHTAAIDRALQAAQATADANLRAMEEIAVGIGEISQEAQALQQVSKDNAESTERLGLEIGKFRV
jgi:methyl-accepting chemotaxis protein